MSQTHIQITTFFLLSIAITSSLSSSPVRAVDPDADFLSKYERYQCHPGFRKQLTPSLIKARMFCKAKGITDVWCFRACLYEHLGTYPEGTYNKQVANAHIANQFDSADNPLIPKWQKETEACANRHIPSLPDYRGGDGLCEPVALFVQCLVESRNC